MAEYNQYNPIRSVDGRPVLCPSSYQWALEDLSANDAGRTEDTRMDKKRIGQVVKLNLEWVNVPVQATSELLKAFNPEYIQVCYLDAMTGKYVTSEFYVGNRTAPLYNTRINCWTKISFNLIERSGVKEDV